MTQAKSEFIQVRVSPELKKALVAKAAAKGTTVSAATTRAWEKWVAEEPKQVTPIDKGGA